MFECGSIKVEIWSPDVGFENGARFPLSSRSLHVQMRKRRKPVEVHRSRPQILGKQFERRHSITVRDERDVFRSCLGAIYSHRRLSSRNSVKILMTNVEENTRRLKIPEKSKVGLQSCTKVYDLRPLGFRDGFLDEFPNFVLLKKRLLRGKIIVT